jgi:hypothetical protein
MRPIPDVMANFDVVSGTNVASVITHEESLASAKLGKL